MNKYAYRKKIYDSHVAVNILRQMTIGRYKNLTPRLDLHFYDAFKMIIGSKMAISFFMKKDLGKIENTIAFFLSNFVFALLYIKKRDVSRNNIALF